MGRGGINEDCAFRRAALGPLHFHHGTEEALYAVSGRAKLRTPEGETPLSEGDFVSFPPGGLLLDLLELALEMRTVEGSQFPLRR